MPILGKGIMEKPPYAGRNEHESAKNLHQGKNMATIVERADADPFGFNARVGSWVAESNRQRSCEPILSRLSD